MDKVVEIICMLYRAFKYALDMLYEYLSNEGLPDFIKMDEKQRFMQYLMVDDKSEQITQSAKWNALADFLYTGGS